MRLRLPALAAASLLLSSPAFAAFHEIKIKEVFAGSEAHPTAQYVILQAYSLGQNAVTNHSVTTFDAAGAPTGTFTFPGPMPLPNGADQMTIFVATPDAATIFNITADLAMTPVLSPAGGKVCWDGATPDDCVAWGNYTGGATGVGAPYNPTGGLIPSYAARRRLDICLAFVNLDGCDDTDDSASDFVTAVPDPIKNNGNHGQTPPATCGNGTQEGLERCDDNNTDDGDGCSAICRIEPGLVSPGVLLVDPVDGAASDGNGVFEPGETVEMQPFWHNGDMGPVPLTGQLTHFLGAANFYLIVDGAADYGTIVAGGTRTCAIAPNCYNLAVPPQARPSQHWDPAVDEIASTGGEVTWPLHLGDSFADVPRSHGFYTFIETLLHNEVTGGCAGGNYCPGNPVTRAQMAVFLLKAKFGSAHVPPQCTGALFPDVPCTGGAFDPWIEELFTLGITGGCGGGNYCPGNTVTRAQMAVFLLKTLEGSAYDPPDCNGDFEDVPCTPGVGFPDWIEELYARGITGGCSASPALYCPDSPNNRGQMAVFLVKTFLLLLYGFEPLVA